MKEESLDYMFSSYHSNIELLPIPEVGIYERNKKVRKKEKKTRLRPRKRPRKKFF